MLEIPILPPRAPGSLDLATEVAKVVRLSAGGGWIERDV